MNISGVGFYSGNYNYINNINTKQAEQPVTQQTQQSQAAAVPAQSEPQRQVIRQNQSTGVNDFARQYEIGRVYQKMQGADMSSLDTPRNVSGAQRAQIMQQYQTFMGDNRANTSAAKRSTQNFDV
jgi:hypothetical protein